MFKRSRDVPSEISEAGLEGWYSSLDDQSKVKLGRYLANAATDSPASFLLSVMDASLSDENYAFASFIGETAWKEDMDDLMRFMLGERLIEAYMGSERYDDAKRQCHANLDMYPTVRDTFVAMNGGMPEKMNCRNRLIDVMVGIESDYDGAMRMFERFFDMGLISKEDLEFRMQSLKVHRLQRTFDGVYTYRRKE